MTSALAPAGYNPLLELVAASADKHFSSRLGQFAAWQMGRAPWWQPDLAAYRAALLDDGLQPSSVASYLSTIRAAYHRLLASNSVRQYLYQVAGGESDADKKARVDELVLRIRNAIDPANAPVQVTAIQDRADSQQVRLTADEARRLVSAPGTDTLIGLRDTAILAVLLCTGLREGELVALVVDDLWQQLDGELAVLVRHGKGDKQRLVPYGDLDWCLHYVEWWLAEAGITGGPVFRGFWPRGGIRDDALTTRSVQSIVKGYPVRCRNGETVVVRPHDLRRTYARLQYEAGMDLVAIQQNLGHADLTTTLGYIGQLDVSRRRGRAW